MPFTVRFDPEHQVVHITIQGKYNLADVREIDADLSVADLYSAPEMFQKTFRETPTPAPLLRRAVVAKAGTPNFAFLENVVANRGQTMKLFTEVDEAMHWLCSQDSR